MSGVAMNSGNQMIVYTVGKQNISAVESFVAYDLQIQFGNFNKLRDGILIKNNVCYSD